MGFISGIQIFHDVPYELLEATLAGSAGRELAAGDVLLEPGQRNDSIYLLERGRLRIHLDARDSMHFVQVEPGSCIGEMSIIDGKPVSAWVVAHEASRILELPAATFWERLMPIPRVAHNLLRLLSERMRLNNELILSQIRGQLALEHLQKELQIARSLQASMLPRNFAELSRVEGAGIFAIMDPAKDVGGDFYDAFATGPDRIFVAIGDVSGKGIPAALFMARTITQLRVEAMREPRPDRVLANVNAALSRDNDSEMFVSLFCGVLEVSTGRFAYSNAGHNAPVSLVPGDAAAYLPVPKGLVVGAFDGAVYRVIERPLVPGEAIVLYTDGVTEATDPDDTFYGEDRLLAALSLDANPDPQALVAQVRHHVQQFARGSPQSDDLTLLALRWHPDRNAGQA